MVGITATGGLTGRQAALLRFIGREIEENGGVAPSFDEMRIALGLASKSGVHRLVSGLTERGFIRRLPNRARALEVIRMPGHVDIGGLRRLFSDKLWADIEKAARLEKQTPFEFIVQSMTCFTEITIDEHEADR